MQQISHLKFYILCFVILIGKPQALNSQNIEAKVISYNVLAGGVSGGLGALINKKKDQKWYKAFAKGFVVGMGGGAIAYSGKKMNELVAKNQNLGYCWLSRAVFCAGNSIVENAAANRPFWAQWHYDVAFVRLEFQTERSFKFTPRVMPSTLGGIAVMASQGRLDAQTSLRSGTITFRTQQIKASPNLVASTMSNGFLFVDTLRAGFNFYNTYAHEMIHAFQFQEFSGINYFFLPLSDKWKQQYPFYKKASRWIYMDLNYEAMLVNYFLIQGGHKGRIYCRNYLENEAEFLSVGRSACYP